MTDPGTLAPLMGEPLAVELMNTRWADRDGSHDALASPEDAIAWLGAVSDRLTWPQTRTGSGGSKAGAPAELESLRPKARRELAGGLRELRDAVRRLAAEVTGDPRTDAESPLGDHRRAVAAVDRAAAAVPTWSRLTWPDDGPARRTVQAAGPPARAALSLLAEDAITLFAGPARDQLRACLAPGCVLYFVRDHPRREWCSGACGNRARVARHYRRHHGDGHG